MVQYQGIWLIPYYLTKFFNLKNIRSCTFIGKSTISILQDENKTKNSYIVTCDVSNDIKLPWKVTKINQYRLYYTIMMEKRKKIWRH